MTVISSSRKNHTANVFGETETTKTTVQEYESVILLDPETNFKSSLLDKTFNSPQNQRSNVLEASVTDLINPPLTARFGESVRESTQRRTFRDTLKSLKSFDEGRKKVNNNEHSWIVKPYIEDSFSRLVHSPVDNYRDDSTVEYDASFYRKHPD